MNVYGNTIQWCGRRQWYMHGPRGCRPVSTQYATFAPATLRAWVCACVCVCMYLNVDCLRQTIFKFYYSLEKFRRFHTTFPHQPIELKCWSEKFADSWKIRSLVVIFAVTNFPIYSPLRLTHTRGGAEFSAPPWLVAGKWLCARVGEGKGSLFFFFFAAQLGLVCAFVVVSLLCFLLLE